MSYSYGYQYKQQCYIPSGVKSPVAAFPQPCPGPGLLPCGSCSPCGSCQPCSSCQPCGPCQPCGTSGAKLCTVRKTLASPCQPACVETRVVEGHRSSSSSCSSSRCLAPCPAPFPQPLVQGGQLAALGRCPQVCQDGSCPYSYQWSNSYQYKCGQ